MCEWALLDVGCLHCGAPTRVISLHETEAAAEAALDHWWEAMEADPDEEEAGTSGCWFDRANGMMHAAIVIRLRPDEVAW